VALTLSNQGNFKLVLKLKPWKFGCFGCLRRSDVKEKIEIGIATYPNMQANLKQSFRTERFDENNSK